MGTEAQPLTADYAGTSRNPMIWEGRVYFISDRDGTQNLWSMDRSGKDLKQLTFHKGWDIQSASLSQGRVAYQLGADLRLYDISKGTDRLIPITLATDLDHRREHWVKTPMDYVTQAHLSPEGDRVVLTARGKVFVAPVEAGRIVEASRKQAGARIRDARFSPDGKELLVLSDATGEVELWSLSANGEGKPRQLSSHGGTLRWEGLPSPDGKHVAHTDKEQRLWILDTVSGTEKLVARSEWDRLYDLRWSPDGAWLAFVQASGNQFPVVRLYDVARDTATTVTSDRFESGSPTWSPDGKWLYFLSSRHFRSLVRAPWGLRNPEPFFDRQTGIYALALQKGLRSPFQPRDELQVRGEGPKAKEGVKAAPPVDLDGIQERLTEIPVEPGNYRGLATDGKRLFWLAAEAGAEGKASLLSLKIGNRPPFKPDVILEEVTGFELTRKVLARKGSQILVLDPDATTPPDVAKAALDLRDWSFSVNPGEEWRQMFIDAWRMERDYFYDKGMHKVDWPAVRDKYLPLVDRVTDREELSNLFGQMIGELSALHMFVRGGDLRSGPDRIEPASLGAELSPAGEGWRVDWIYQGDPDLPGSLSPLARAGVEVQEGDLILAIDGTPLTQVAHPDLLIRNHAGKQLLLRVRHDGSERDVIVVPISSQAAASMRYSQWEITRRQEVERRGGGRIGYVHLRAMGAQDIARWYQDFYPVVDKEGLIIDMRHNQGGNIDSWILEKLLRKAWFYWKPPVGRPYPNMPEAFRGHMVVLCDAWTASDGEAFCEGFRRFGLGKVIGTRTWGGEIWLNSDNFLVDGGIATAAENGVFGLEGAWLIEGHGVDPDLVVDNLPHATFLGRDAQLEAALAHLEERIRNEPRPLPSVPAYPDKSR